MQQNIALGNNLNYGASQGGTRYSHCMYSIGMGRSEVRRIVIVQDEEIFPLSMYGRPISSIVQCSRMTAFDITVCTVWLSDIEE